LYGCSVETSDIFFGSYHAAQCTRVSQFLHIAIRRANVQGHPISQLFPQFLHARAPHFPAAHGVEAVVVTYLRAIFVMHSARALALKAPARFPGCFAVG
jgi:hypothetical protein